MGAIGAKDKTPRRCEAARRLLQRLRFSSIFFQFLALCLFLALCCVAAFVSTEHANLPGMGRLHFELNYMGCPNRSPLRQMLENFQHKTTRGRLSDMNAYCTLNRDGQADPGQRELCCGWLEPCPPKLLCREASDEVKVEAEAVWRLHLSLWNGGRISGLELEAGSLNSTDRAVAIQPISRLLQIPSTRQEEMPTSSSVEVRQAEPSGGVERDWRALFGNVFVIHTPGQTQSASRLANAEAQLRKVGLWEGARVWASELDLENGHRGCWRAHRAVAREARRQGLISVTVFEDDLVIKDSVVHKFDEIMGRAASFLNRLQGWEVFFWAFNPVAVQLYPESEWLDSDGKQNHIVGVYGWSTVAYTIQGRALRRLAESRDVRTLPESTVDGILNRAVAFSVLPMVASHPPNLSLITHKLRNDLKWDTLSSELLYTAGKCTDTLTATFRMRLEEHQVMCENPLIPHDFDGALSGLRDWNESNQKSSSGSILQLLAPKLTYVILLLLFCVRTLFFT